MGTDSHVFSCSDNINLKTRGCSVLMSFFIFWCKLFWSWGRNQNGQLGLGTTEDSLVPQKIQAFQVLLVKLAFKTSLGSDPLFLYLQIYYSKLDFFSLINDYAMLSLWFALYGWCGGGGGGRGLKAYTLCNIKVFKVMETIQPKKGRDWLFLQSIFSDWEL